MSWYGVTLNSSWYSLLTIPLVQQLRSDDTGRGGSVGSSSGTGAVGVQLYAAVLGRTHLPSPANHLKNSFSKDVYANAYSEF